jgi:hypothetical protein
MNADLSRPNGLTARACSEGFNRISEGAPVDLLLIIF